MAESVDENWTVSRGTIDQLPTTIRCRESLPAAISPTSHSRLLTIAWAFAGNPATKLPTPDEGSEMGVWEDMFIPAVEQDDVCVLFAVVTNDNVRRWYLYCRDMEMAQNVIFKKLGRSGDLPLEFHAQDDESWETYERILRACRKKPKQEQSRDD